MLALKGSVIFSILTLTQWLQAHFHRLQRPLCSFHLWISASFRNNMKSFTRLRSYTDVYVVPTFQFHKNIRKPLKISCYKFWLVKTESCRFVSFNNNKKTRPVQAKLMARFYNWRDRKPSGHHIDTVQYSDCGRIYSRPVQTSKKQKTFFPHNIQSEIYGRGLFDRVISALNFYFFFFNSDFNLSYYLRFSFLDPYGPPDIFHVFLININCSHHLPDNWEIKVRTQIFNVALKFLCRDQSDALWAEILFSGDSSFLNNTYNS